MSITWQRRVTSWRVKSERHTPTSQSHSTPPPATQSSSSHHFCLFSVLLCLSAPLVTELRAQSAPAPVLSRSHSHTRGNYYCPGKICLLDCSLFIPLSHTDTCRKVLLHTATNLAIIFSNIFFQTFTYGQNNCLWTLICSMYKITTSWDTGVPLPTSIYVVTVSLMQLKLTPLMTTHNPLWHMCAFHSNTVLVKPC